MSLLFRLKAAWAAFQFAKHRPYFAVIYDSYEGLDREKDDAVESYYEIFTSPEEAYEIFEQAFPRADREAGLTAKGSERLVMVLGDIDNYGGVYKGLYA